MSLVSAAVAAAASTPSSSASATMPIHILVHNVTHSDIVIDCAPTKFRPKRGVAKVLHGLNKSRFKRTKFSDQDVSGTSSERDTQRITVRPKFNSFNGVTSRLLDVVERTLAEKRRLREEKRDHPDSSLSDGQSKTMPLTIDAGSSLSHTPVDLEPSRSIAIAKDGTVHTDSCTTGFVLPQIDDRRQSSSAAPGCGGWEDYHVADDGREVDISERLCPESVHFPLVASLLPFWARRVCRAHAPVSQQVLVLLSGTAASRRVSRCGGQQSAPDEKNSTYPTAKLIQHFVQNFYPEIRVVQVNSGEGIFKFKHNVRFINKNLKPIIQAYCRSLAASIGDAWSDFLHVCISLTDGSPARIAALNSGLREFRPDYLHLLQPKSFFHSHIVDTRDVSFQSFDQIELRPAIPESELSERGRAIVAETKILIDKYDRSAQERNEMAHFWLRKTKKPVLAVLLVDKGDGTPPRFFHGVNMEVSMPTGSLCAERNCISSALASDFTLRRQDLKMVAVVSMEPATKSKRKRRVRALSSSSSTLSSGISASSESWESSPIKRRRVGTPYDSFLTRHSSTSPRKVNDDDKCPPLQPEETLNPIAPCGSCMEWLRKIAESNPDFRMLSFSDTSCERVFVRPVSVAV